MFRKQQQFLTLFHLLFIFDCLKELPLKLTMKETFWQELTNLRNFK